MTYFFKVSLGSKVPSGIDVTIDPTNQTALDYLIEYGLKQSLNDCIAAIKVTDADYTADKTKAIVLKRLDAIMAGTVQRAGTREASDPYAAEIKRLAFATFKALPDQKRKSAMLAVIKAGLNEKDAKAHIIGLYMKDDGIIAKAKANVDATRATAAEFAGGINLDDLGLTNESDDETDDTE